MKLIIAYSYVDLPPIPIQTLPFIRVHSRPLIFESNISKQNMNLAVVP
jgi:hypothetical protein